jgi:hypothetical protein
MRRLGRQPLPSAPVVTLLARLRVWRAHDDPAAETANTIAILVGWNGPFYPLYLLGLIGRHVASTAPLTLFATPLFLALPWLSRRSSQAGRFGLVLVGSLNTLWCMKLMGPGSGVELFLLPCIALAALLFRRREQWVMLVAAVLPCASYFAPESMLGTPLMGLSAPELSQLYALNATSVLLLLLVLAAQFAWLLRRIADVTEK